MDEIARRYVLLGLRLGRLVPGFVDSYVGPPELADVVAGEQDPLPADLHDEALGLGELVAGLPEDTDAQHHRRRWFEGQLTSMRAHARAAAGEEIGFLDLCDQLLGLRVTPVPEAELQAARARLDSALPGSGSIADRMAAAREQQRVPSDATLDAMAASATRFREVTRRDFALPDDEGIDWAAAHDEPWGAYARFLGRGRTRIEINLSLPFEVPAIAYLASHEAYPGHHAEHIAKERSLIHDAGLGEATLRTMNTPEAVLSEGQADVGREVVMSDRELEEEMRRIGRAVGVDADWAAVVAISGAVFELNSAIGNAAIMLHHEGRPEAEVREWMEAISPASPELLDHAMRVLKDPAGRTYAFTYRDGARLIRPWLEVQGQTTGFARLLTEQLSPAILADDLAEADVATAAR
jgi:hypothetical protein